VEPTIRAGRRNVRDTSSSFCPIDCSVEEETTEEEEDMRDRSLARFRIALDLDSEILPRPRSTFTLFIFLFLKLRSSAAGFGVVVVFMVGRTSRSVMCFVCRGGSWSSTIPPQFFTQFSPVMKLFPLPPHPLNLNLLQTWRAASKW